MKKRLAAIFVCAIMAASVLSGCGKQQKGADGSLSAEAEQDTVISTDTLLAATDYDVNDYVKLMDNYMGMDVTLTSNYEITDESVRSYIEDYVLPYYPLQIETDKKVVENGDFVNIDYVGKKDGEPFDNGTAEGYLLEIGSGSFIDGFEDGLIGKEVGGTYDLNLTFPEEYQSELLAGQDVVFTVTVNSIVEQKPIAYEDMTDAYVADNFGTSGMNTIDDLNEAVRTQLESENESDRTYDIQNIVLERLKSESEVTIPDGLLESRIQETIDSIKKEAESAQMEYDEYVSSNYGQTAEELEKYLTETMQEQLTQELVLEAVVADQKITISQKDFESFVSTYLTSYGYDNEEDFYAAYGGKEYVQLIFAEGQALDKVKEAANAIEAEKTEEQSAEGTSEAAAEQ